MYVSIVCIAASMCADTSAIWSASASTSARDTQFSFAMRPF
jgi:hypothetical protein